MWAVRCQHEAKLHEQNCFVTLTYSPEHMPEDGSVSVREVQLFMKRLRKAIEPRKVRFFAVGEYGDSLARPHYHLLLFGWEPGDQKQWRTSAKGYRTFRSELLETIWGKGHVELGRVTAQSAGYCARYSVKKIRGPLAQDHYRYVNPETGEVYDRRPEFALMSRKPGIGYEWWERYRDDWKSGMCVVEGKEVKLPKYYLRMWERTDPELIEDIKTRRQWEGKKRFSDNTDERLKVKERCKVAQVNLLKREMENENSGNGGV